MKYCLIVPAISAAAQLRVVEFFTREFGGCTAQIASGFWRNENPPPEAVEAQRKYEKDANLPPRDKDPVWAQTETNLLIWAFGPAGAAGKLAALAEEVRELADQDAVLYWTEAGDAQFAFRPQQPGRVKLESAGVPAQRTLN